MHQCTIDPSDSAERISHAIDVEHRQLIGEANVICIARDVPRWIANAALELADNATVVAWVEFLRASSDDQADMIARSGDRCCVGLECGGPNFVVTYSPDASAELRAAARSIAVTLNDPPAAFASEASVEVVADEHFVPIKAAYFALCSALLRLSRVGASQRCGRLPQFGAWQQDQS